MGLLGQRLRSMFGKAFNGLYGDAVLHETTLTANPGGGFTPSYIDHQVKVQVDDWSETYKAQNGIPQTDVRVLMLQDCVSVTPTQDDEITVRGQRYRITGPVTQDPAQAYWQLQARPDGT